MAEKTLDPSKPYKRHIFYTVEPEPEEKALIEEIEKVIYFADPKPPEWWTDGDTLRFAYEFDWDLNLICEVIFFFKILNKFLENS